VSASITYPIEWEGCPSNEEWFRIKFKEAAEADGLSPVLALARTDSTWGFALPLMSDGTFKDRLVAHSFTQEDNQVAE
jgi:hypothetical protein